MKNSSERIRRPEVERLEPKRNLAGLVSEGAALSASGGENVVSRSIGMGYRIVEEYLQQSRNVAASIAPAAGSDAINSVAALQSRMARATADMFDVWFQMLNASANVQPGTGASGSSANGGGHANGNGHTPVHAAPAQQFAPDQERTGIEVEIQSLRPARVAVDLRPGAGRSSMLVHALRSTDETLPRISGVSVEAASSARPVLVRVAVPADQPAGIYSGMIIDEASSLPVGTLSVVVSDGSKG